MNRRFLTTAFLVDRYTNVKRITAIVDALTR